MKVWLSSYNHIYLFCLHILKFLWFISYQNIFILVNQCNTWRTLLAHTGCAITEWSCYPIPLSLIVGAAIRTDDDSVTMVKILSGESCSMIFKIIKDTNFWKPCKFIITIFLSRLETLIFLIGQKEIGKNFYFGCGTTDSLLTNILILL